MRKTSLEGRKGYIPPLSGAAWGLAPQ